MLTLVLFVASQYNGLANLVEDSFGTNAWLYLITGTSGTILVFMLSSLFKSPSKRMEFLGVNSQIIYEIHPVFFYLAPATMVLLGWSLAEYDALLSIFWPMRFVFGFVLAIAFTFLVLRNRVLSLIFTGRNTK